MLTSMRKTSSSIFVKLLFVLLIASFAIWGIGDVLRTNPGDGPIEVGDRRISMAAIDREFRGLLDDQSQAMGMQLTPVMGIQFGMLDQAVNNLVSRAMIDDLAVSSGLRVDDDTIRIFIRDQMGFVTDSGDFDRARFDQDMRSRNISEQAFIDQLRRDIARQDLLQSVIGGMRIPQVEAETLRAYREETRIADFVRVGADAMDEPEAPADADLQAYYEENGDDYMASEYRSGAVVVLDATVLAEGVEVDEEQLNEEYLYREDTLFVPEQRRVEQMILADEAQAEAAAAALQEGQSFSSVADEIAGQDEASLNMGAFGESDWFIPDAFDALFGGEVGAVTEPVETPLGWRIFRLAEIEAAHQPTLDEVRDELAQDIAERIADDMVYDLSAQFQDEIAGGQSLMQAAELLGLTADAIGPVSASGQGPDDQPVEVAGGDTVLSALFEQQPGIVSSQIDLPDGGVFFVEVEEIVEPALRPFDSVRDRVEAAWAEAQKVEAARAVAQDIHDRLQTGTDIADLAAELGLDVEVAEGIRRDGQSTGGLPSGLAAELFDLDTGDATLSDVSGGDSFFVAQLREVVAAPGDAEAAKALWLQLSAQATNDVFQALGTALQNRIQPTVQSDLIRQTFMQSYGS